MNKKSTLRSVANDYLTHPTGQNGITLVALIITVIILLILAGTAISISINGGDLFRRSQNAVADYNSRVEEENTVVNSYIAYLEQYAEGGEGPVTGTLEVDYDLLADVENTYKKVTLNISGLAKKSSSEIADELISLGVPVPKDELTAQIESMPEETLNGALAMYGLTATEPATTTITLNGTNVSSYNNSFLATQNGTYNVTVRSASNKVGTVDVVIDGTKIGTTKEQSGINEEIFAAPASVDYTDSNNEYARIPAGYYVGTSSTVNTVANGLVITSSIDGNGHSTGDEYVWIPVADINSMIMCKSNPSGDVCNIEQQTNGSLKCTTHNTTDKTQFCGRLYDPNVDWDNPTVVNDNNIYSGTMESNTSQTWDTYYYHEPDIVSSCDQNDATSGNDYMEKAGISDKTVASFSSQLVNDFYEMAKSVAQYKGFWIARYETGTSGGSKKAQTVANGYENNNMWYGLYRISRSIDSTNKIAKTMIWGSQYDQAIKFIGSQAETGHTDRQLNTTPYPSAYAPLDKMKNMFDLEANLWEWTSGAYNTNSRASRGR